jgi:hypothetical protein
MDKNKSLCTTQLTVNFRTGLNATLPILVEQFRNDTAYVKNYVPLPHIRSTHPIALPSALPNVLPSLQPTFTRRTSRQYLGNLRALKFSISFAIINSVYIGCITLVWTNFESEFFTAKENTNLCPKIRDF